MEHVGSLFCTFKKDNTQIQVNIYTYVDDETVIYFESPKVALEIQTPKKLKELKTMLIEAQVVNYKQNMTYLSYNVSILYMQMMLQQNMLMLPAIKGRVGSQIIEIGIVSDKQIRLTEQTTYLLIIDAYVGAVIKIVSQTYGQQRQVKLFNDIDDVVDYQSSNSYIFYFNDEFDYENKQKQTLVFKLLIEFGDVGLYVHQGKQPMKLEGHHWESNNGTIRQIVLSHQDRQSYNITEKQDIYHITVFGRIASSYTLKVELQEMNHSPIGMYETTTGVIDVNELTLFELYTDNDIRGIKITITGNAGVTIKQCQWNDTSCNTTMEQLQDLSLINFKQQQIFYGNNTSGSNTYNFYVGVDQCDQVCKLIIGVFSITPQLVEYSLYVRVEQSVIILRENALQQGRLELNQSQTYELDVSKIYDYIESIDIAVTTHYGILIGYSSTDVNLKSIGLNILNDLNFRKIIDGHIQFQFPIHGSTISLLIICRSECVYSILTTIHRQQGVVITTIKPWQQYNLIANTTIQFQVEPIHSDIVGDTMSNYRSITITSDKYVIIPYSANWQYTNTYSGQYLEITNPNQSVTMNITSYTKTIHFQCKSEDGPANIQILYAANQLQVPLIDNVELVINQSVNETMYFQYHSMSNIGRSTIVYNSYKSNVNFNVCYNYNTLICKDGSSKDALPIIQEFIQQCQSNCTLEIIVSVDQDTQYSIKVLHIQDYFILDTYKQLTIPLIDQYAKIVHPVNEIGDHIITLYFDNNLQLILDVYITITGNIDTFPNKLNFDFKHDVFRQYIIIQESLIIQYCAHFTKCYINMLIHSRHQTDQMLNVQVSVGTIQLNINSINWYQLDKFMNFRIDTITQDNLILTFNYSPKIHVYMSYGCDVLPSQLNYDWSIDLEVQSVYFIENIVPGCYMLHVQNTHYDTVALSIQWTQGQHQIYQLIPNVAVQHVSTTLDTYYYMEAGLQVYLSFHGFSGQHTLQIYSNICNDTINGMINKISTMPVEQLDSTTNIQILNGTCPTLIKTIFSQITQYTILARVYTIDEIFLQGNIQLTGTLMQNLSDHYVTTNSGSNNLTIYTIKGSVELTIYQPLESDQTYQINHQITTISIGLYYAQRMSFTIKNTGIGESQYAIQLIHDHINLDYDKILISDQQFHNYSLPYSSTGGVKQIGFSLVHTSHNQNCTKDIQLTSKYGVQLINNNSNTFIEDIKLGQGLNYLSINLSCIPVQQQQYLIYIKGDNLTMLIPNISTYFRSNYRQTQYYFIHTEEPSTVLVQIEQYSGTITGYITQDIDHLYEGVTELELQTFNNYYYKLLVNLEHDGEVYIGVKCIHTDDHCDYRITVNLIKQSQLSLNDWEIGNISYQLSSDNQIILNMPQLVMPYCTFILYLAYNNEKLIVAQTNQTQISVAETPHISVLAEFKYQDIPLYIRYEMEINIPIKQTAYSLEISIIIMVILIVLIIFLILIYYIRRLKLKLKYEMSDARNLVNELP